MLFDDPTDDNEVSIELEGLTHRAIQKADSQKDRVQHSPHSRSDRLQENTSLGANAVEPRKNKLTLHLRCLKTIKPRITVIPIQARLRLSTTLLR